MASYPGRLVLLGDPVAHSLSPAFQNAALRAAKIPLNYEALRVPPEKLPAVMRALKGERGAGNITIPHKLAAFELCDRVTDVARRARAINTFWTADDGLLVGDNTDVGGFNHAVRTLAPRSTENARVVVLGAGGAAAAVLTAIASWQNASAVVVARNQLRASDLALRFEDVARIEKTLERALDGATLIVNATPIGLRDDDQPCEVSIIPPDAALLDLVYRKGGTPWVNAAHARGLRAMDGLQMLLEQGALSFQRWFGMDADRGAMARALE